MDKMIYNGKEYELAEFKMNIARLVEAAEQSESMYGAYKAELELVTAAVGQESVVEIFGTSDLEEIDLAALVVVYNLIVEGYEKRISDLEQKKTDKAMGDIRELAGNIRAIESATKTVKKRW